MSKLVWRKQLLRGMIAGLTSIVIVGGGGLPLPSVSFAPSPNHQQHSINGETPHGETTYGETSRWKTIDSALATSGGRSSGGSFGSSSGGSSSGGSSSSGSTYQSSGSSSSGSYSSGDSSGEGGAIVLIFVFGIVMILVVLKIIWSLLCKIYEQSLIIFEPEQYRQIKARKLAAKKQLKARQESRRRVAQQVEEKGNDIVTVTQVQVALLASAKEVQERFNEIPTECDWSTPEGLEAALKETVLTLLRSPEAWTHVSTQSKTLPTRESAKQYFDLLSVEERSKFEMESLVNVGGNIKKRAIVTKEDGPADYIVATLIVGTAHDQLLLTEIHSAEELHDGLKRLGAIAPGYLMVYEMLWSPQDASDSLTYEELLLNYPHMLQIC